MAGLVRAQRPDAPDRPMVSSGGELVDAEPAVPGWQIAVNLTFA